MTRDEVRLNGVYTNIKTGNPYRVVGNAFHTEREEELVLYVRSDIGGKTYARPFDLFLEKFEPRFVHSGGPSAAG